MRRAVFALSLIACTLAACAPQPQVATPSAAALLTETVAASTASPTPAFTSTSAAAAPTLAPPSRGVALLAPGSGSAVGSPITLHALLQPGAEQVLIELVDASGALLYRRLLNAPGVELRELIDFDVRAEGAARLTVLVLDALGRTSFATSVALELLIDGTAQAADLAAAGEIIIDVPAAGAELGPGQVTVSGRVSGSSTRPLVIQLLNQAGRVLVSQEVYPGDLGDDGYRPFRIVLVVDITEDTPVLVTVGQSGGAVPGLWLLNSVDVELLAE